MPGPEPYKEIYRGESAMAHAPMMTGAMRHQSPQAELEGFSSDLGDPEGEPLGWNPIGWVANKASATADVLRSAGASIIDSTRSLALDLAGTVSAAMTGQPPSAPGPIFEHATGLAQSVNRLLPEPVQKKLGTEQSPEIAGYITLADGRKIPVPKAANAQAQGEKALSDVAMAALTKARLDDALNRSKLKLQEQAQATTANQWSQVFALNARAAAQKERLGDIQEEALRLALERETSSPAQRALWGRPSTLDTSKEPPHRRILAIGSGLPGGILIG